MNSSKYNREYYIKNRKKLLLQIRRYQKKNIEKCRKRQKNYNKKNSKKRNEYSRYWRIKKKYGISKKDWFDLLKKQHRKCAICGDPLPKNFDKVHLDHCHKSNTVRGIVHSHCNLILGFSKENIHILKNAIKYLIKHSK